MIHLALWLVSLCVVVFFGFVILAGIMHLIGSIGVGVGKAFRSDRPSPPVVRTIVTGEINAQAPGWVSVASWITFLAVVVGASMLADEAARTRSAAMAGWMYIALGVIVGLLLAVVVFVVLMREVMSSRRKEAAMRTARETEIENETRKARHEAREASLRAYPDYLDDDMLRDPSGIYAWPDHLFSKSFVVPDVIVPYTSKYGQDGVIRLWSKIFVAEQSCDPDYVEYREELERERHEFEEEHQREEEERRAADAEARALGEAERGVAEALAARKAQQIVISLDELKRNKKR